MTVQRLWLTDFRNHKALEVSLDPGVTVVVGANGDGKTNLLEGLAWLARGTSFRGASTEAMVRKGADRAAIRAEVVDGDRVVLLEAELVASGRNRIQINKNRVQRRRDLLGHFRTTVFGPDDLILVKGGPAERRTLIDDLLVDLQPRNQALRADLDRILRQRNTLLKQARGRSTPKVNDTLDVWDAKLSEVGEALTAARMELLAVLGPEANQLLEMLTGGRSGLTLTYVDEWTSNGLAAALRQVRPEDLRRGLSTVGPHRDEVRIEVDDLPARTHASQGEQRSVALALRLAGHRIVVDRTETDPVVLLDDVFSELDDDRSRALVDLLPTTQAILTTASAVPAGVAPGTVLRLSDGTLG
ncbi:MAG: DNA replication/repair protein RecF [Actinomycetota bacterium]|nr:DNA replication/repair protein RecF [Actinomycetota bacterium]